MSSKPQHNYLPQLDGIRTIAIGLVLIFHWLPTTHWINTLPNGTIGVTLFFVLSGFLITDILIKNKTESLGGAAQVYKNFMIRRALRIFPIYYLTLAVGFALPKLHIPFTTALYQHPWYYILYTYNHLLEKTGFWADAFSPYWSLAVEEQFYLVWAFVVLLIPKKHTITLLWTTVILGIIFRFYFIYIQQGQGLITVTCIDCFAWGGLLSWYRINHVQDQLHRLLRYTVLPSLAILLYVSFVKDNTATLVKILFLRTAISCISAYILSLICSPKPHWLNTVLSSAPMVFVGKISYGVYVYHMTVPLLFWFVWQKFHLPAIGNHFASLIVLLVASYLSWILFEKPINNLKKYFPYQEKK